MTEGWNLNQLVESGPITKLSKAKQMKRYLCDSNSKKYEVDNSPKLKTAEGSWSQGLLVPEVPWVVICYPLADQWTTFMLWLESTWLCNL